MNKNYNIVSEAINPKAIKTTGSALLGAGAGFVTAAIANKYLRRARDIIKQSNTPQECEARLKNVITSGSVSIFSRRSLLSNVFGKLINILNSGRMDWKKKCLKVVNTERFKQSMGGVLLGAGSGANIAMNVLR